MEPKPDSRKEYLHGILQGIGDVERDGFRILGDLGARPVRPTVVLSCGGGAKNDVWISMRERSSCRSEESSEHRGKLWCSAIGSCFILIRYKNYVSTTLLH